MNKNNEQLKNDALTIVLAMMVIMIHAGILSVLYFAPHADFGHKTANLLIVWIVSFLLAVVPIGLVAIPVITGTLMIIIYYLNEYLLVSRGKPIHYLDIFCIKDAVRVSGKYPLIMNGSIILHLLLGVLLTAAACVSLAFLKKRMEGTKLLKSGIATIVLILMVIWFLNLSSWDLGIKELTWDDVAYVNDNGLLYAVYSEYKTGKVQKPSGYTVKKAKDILDRYDDVQEEKAAANAPDNIILIMNEAFTDYALLGEVDMNDDPLANIHGMRDNFVQGKLAVSVLGGQTCNTEFEVLTSIPLAFFPVNTMPYMQFDLEHTEAQSQMLQECGYAGTALHGYYGEEYNRNTIYDRWFSNGFISGEEFSDEDVEPDEKNLFDVDDNYGTAPTFGSEFTYINRFISDEDCFKKAEAVIREQNDAGKNTFTYIVTIQNHGGYAENEGYDRVDYLGGEGKEYENNYLTLTSITDCAFADFLDRLKRSDKKTVVIMFGDHQPFFIDTIPKNVSSEDEYKTAALSYMTTYIAWANYDVAWDIPEVISANYLMPVIKRNLGLKLDAYEKTALAAMDRYPALTWYYAVGKNGEYGSPQEARKNEMIRDYELTSYYRLFDDK